MTIRGIPCDVGLEPKIDAGTGTPMGEPSGQIRIWTKIMPSATAAGFTNAIVDTGAPYTIFPSREIAAPYRQSRILTGGNGRSRLGGHLYFFSSFKVRLFVSDGSNFLPVDVVARIPTSVFDLSKRLVATKDNPDLSKMDEQSCSKIFEPGKLKDRIILGLHCLLPRGSVRIEPNGSDFTFRAELMLTEECVSFPPSC